MIRAESKLAAQVLGTDVSSTSSAFGIKRWIEDQCREGSLATFVEKFVAGQNEVLDPKSTLLKELKEDRLILEIKVKMFDHEADEPLEGEVKFSLDPITGETCRLLC